jgi:hydrophobe/amphiphile efflux-1 (HAE1) family protein
MFLSDVSIKRPVFTAMVTIGLMTLGFLATKNIGVDLFPDVAFPIVTVQTIYPGAGPEEVEQQVSKQIEEAVASTNGVDTVKSFSRDSVSIVVIQFKLEADVKAAATDVREKIAAIRTKLPKDIKDPIIQRFDPSALPILTYVVSSNRNPAETRRYAEDVIKPKLESIDGVAAVNVIGGLEREVRVFIDRRKLDSLGMSLAQVAQQLGSEGFDLPAGRITSGANELNIKTEGRFRSLDELRNVVVASLASGAQVRLKDVASVEDSYKEVRTTTRLDGNPSVTLEVQKQAGSNTVAIADKVYKSIEKVKGQLPSDFKILNAIDQSVFIRRNIDAVSHDIIFGGLMAVLVIFLFMLDWRSTLISSLSLPTSVVTTFLAMWWMGFTFNMMSLLALSLSIGLLIDDAVVVRENIYRHMEMGKDPVTAAREGTNEIGLAVMATTFTIVAVFVPVGFMGGLVGKMFKQFGLTVAAAVLVSLFVSFTLDPMMSARVMKPVEKGHHEKLKHHPIYGRILAFYEAMDNYYRDVLRWALSHKWLVMLGAAGLFFGSMFLTKYMGKEFVTPEDRGEFRVALEMPAGTSLPEMERVTTEAEAIIRKASPEVKSLYTVVGPSEEANKANVRVYAVKKDQRPGITQWDIQGKIRQALSTVPNLKFSANDLGLIEGGDERPVMLFLRGEDYEKLQEVARNVLAVVRDVKGATDVDMSFRAGKPETNVRVDRAKAADLGVGVGTVAQTLRLALEGDIVAKYRDGDRDYDVRVQLTPEDRASLETLPSLTVPVTGRKMGVMPNPMAAPRLVEIRDVANIISTTGPATIERENRQRQIIITSNLSNRPLGDVIADIEVGLKKVQMPVGVTYTFGGQAERMAETFSNMGLALGIAILFIFFVLASQFESIIHPFTIMFALPLAIVGALLLLFLAGQSIGMPAMIGIILLMGLVTKNAILLVDYANELRERGYKMVDALLEAGPTRLRPILMTSAAMVLGMVPAAMSTNEGSEFRSPMSTAVIGGVVASTFLTLLVVPIVYSWMDRFTSRGRAERRAELEQESGKTGADSERYVPAAAMVATPSESTASDTLPGLAGEKA